MFEVIYSGKKVDVYQTLKDAIQYLNLIPGSTIQEPAVAAELGVSRTPVREALIRLSRESLIDIFPQRGTYVSHIDFAFAKEVAYMRHILETEIFLKLCEEKTDLYSETEEVLYFMQQAIKRNNPVEYLKKDNQFHKTIFAHNHHELIWDIISISRAHYNRVVIMDLQLEGHIEQSYQHHCDIVKCIAEGDQTKLTAILDKHHDHEGMDYDLIENTFPEYFQNGYVRKSPPK